MNTFDTIKVDEAAVSEQRSLSEAKKAKMDAEVTGPWTPFLGTPWR